MKCRGHTAYPERIAWHVAKRMARDGDAVHAWRCRRCGSWHVGYDRNRETARKAKRRTEADRVGNWRRRKVTPPDDAT